MAPSGKPSRVTGTWPHPRRSRARRTSRVRTPRTSHPVSAAPGCDASPSLTATIRTSTPRSHNICNSPPHPRISSSGWGDTTHARRLDGTSKGGRARRGWDRRQVASLVPRCWSSTTKLTQNLRPPRGPRAPRPGARGVELGRRTGLRRAGLVAHRGREAQLLRLRPRARAPAGRHGGPRAGSQWRDSARSRRSRSGPRQSRQPPTREVRSWHPRGRSHDPVRQAGPRRPKGPILRLPVRPSLGPPRASTPPLRWRRTRSRDAPDRSQEGLSRIARLAARTGIRASD